MYGAYENIVVSSVGLKRFNLLGSSSASRAGMSHVLVTFVSQMDPTVQMQVPETWCTCWC